MSRIIIDIETIGANFDELEPKDQAYLLHFAANEAEQEEIKQRLALHPLTGEIVAVGMLNPETDQGRVYFQAPNQEFKPQTEQGIEYIAAGEKEILERFWQDIIPYQQIITFNGRGFDCPFLLLRSAILGVKTRRNLMPNRYYSNLHCDLLDQFTFYGALKKFKMDFYCCKFGIKSPKAEMDGLQVKPYFTAGKYLEIAKYCAGDLQATKKLWEIWQNYLDFNYGS